MMMKLLLMIMNEKVFVTPTKKKVFESVTIIEHCQTRLHTNKVEIVTDSVVMSDEVMSDKSVDG